MGLNRSGTRMLTRVSLRRSVRTVMSSPARETRTRYFRFWKGYEDSSVPVWGCNKLFVPDAESVSMAPGDPRWRGLRGVLYSNGHKNQAGRAAVYPAMLGQLNSCGRTPRGQ